MVVTTKESGKGTRCVTKDECALVESDFGKGRYECQIVVDYIAFEKSCGTIDTRKGDFRSKIKKLGTIGVGGSIGFQCQGTAGRRSLAREKGTLHPPIYIQRFVSMVHANLEFNDSWYILMFVHFLIDFGGDVGGAGGENKGDSSGG
jgi:hypothetical protein